jgi:nucleoside-diphosphate-sugar epimerase
MKVVITGGAGFIGLRLAQRLLEKGALSGRSGQAEAIDELVLFDLQAPPALPPALDGKVTILLGEIANRDEIFHLIDRDDIAVFHLASVVSGGGEQDFDLAIRVNLDGGLNVLEALRARAGLPRLVFASSIAVFGGAGMPAVVGDTVKQTPQTTYGMAKAVGELLVNDYPRKGFLDGRSALLPTVIIRLGKPNLAASSFVSGVFREPLNGEPCALPVETDTVMPVLGYRAIVDGLIALLEVEGVKLGNHRAVSLPSLTVTVAEMIAALKRVAGERALGEITVEPDPFIQAIVKTWPQDASYQRATALGLPREDSLEEIVEAYIADYLEG